jgi:hypothetical protein
MAQTSWPFESTDTSETQYSLLFRNVGEGVIPDRGLEIEPYADSTGMTAKVKTGDALVRGHYYNSTAETSLTIAAAHASLARIDRVILRLDPSANSIILAVLEGVADAAPAPAALTQTEGDVYEFPVALVAVGAGVTTIAPGNITDQRVILASTATLQSAITAIESDVGTLQTDVGTLQTDLATKAPLLATFVTDATTARTIASADSGKTIRFTSGSATVVTVNASTDFAIGARVDIIADGLGVLTVAASSATIAAAEVSTTTGSFTIGAQYSAATLLCVATDSYRLIGNVSVV